MNDKNSKNSFLDSNTIMAMVITFGIFIGWQKYVEYKYPKPIDKVEKSVDLNGKGKNVTSAATMTKPGYVKSDTQEIKNQISIPSKSMTVDNDFWKFNVNSNGLSIDNVLIKKINKVATEPYSFSRTKAFYATAIDGKVLQFDFKKTDENTFVGTARHKDMTVLKTMKINSEKFLIDVTIELKGSKGKSFDVEHLISGEVQKPKTILFLPAFQRDEFYLKTTDNDERKVLTVDLVLEKPELYPASKLVSLGDQYFAAALLNTGKLLPDTTFDQNNKIVDVKVSHKFSPQIQIDKVEYSLFIGPKNVKLLSSISEDLNDLINFTYLGFISRPIIKALNFFFGIFGNYGIAVIVLTFLIRLMIMPLAVSSFKSMKRMQTIQPELKRIKEKYKDNPQVLNQKTMKVMKDNKVNPVGGCLPMLLQMPIFFAFYRALSESVDLYQAPFFGWITDLSKMDPYFLFPILSMAGMVIHQLVTPSTMDKMQKRMMMIMPVVFGILFVTLPSALTLYMAVSTWFGIGQHVIFLRDKPAAA